jgi:7-carboxy-7-deazaguanine synthase
MKEITLLVDTFSMRSVYLMPEGRTKEEQLERSAKVSEMCMKYNFKFSPRLHIINWGTKRAV